MHPTQNPAVGVDLTPADILRAAAVYLHRYGWTQGDYFAHLPHSADLLPAACANGAIAAAAYGYPTHAPYADHHDDDGRRLFTRAVDFLDDYLSLNDQRPADSDYLVLTSIRWNDTPGRTADHVIAVLDAAADDWQRTHTPGGAR